MEKKIKRFFHVFDVVDSTLCLLLCLKKIYPLIYRCFGSFIGKYCLDHFENDDWCTKSKMTRRFLEEFSKYFDYPAVSEVCRYVRQKDENEKLVFAELCSLGGSFVPNSFEKAKDCLNGSCFIQEDLDAFYICFVGLAGIKNNATRLDEVFDMFSTCYRLYRVDFFARLVQQDCSQYLLKRVLELDHHGLYTALVDLRDKITFDFLVEHSKVDIFESFVDCIAKHQDPDFIEYLLQLDTWDPNIGDSVAFDMCVRAGEANVVKVLIDDKRLDISCFDNSPIRVAAVFGMTDILKMLLDQGDRVDPSDRNNEAIQMAGKNQELESSLMQKFSYARER